jgi:RHS repeat-associated protein
VNGGGEVTVRYSLGDHIDAARQVRVPWQDFVGMEDVVLVEADAAVTVVDLPSVAPQVHQATPQDDADGIRQANLLFAAGTEAELVLSDGSSVAAPTLSVRATEFTVGPNGPRAMPAILPPTSGYTYAVELSADEAVQAGAAQVRFSRPVVVFVDNFLGFPVGDDVPVGSYDPQASAWIPEDDGRVIEVLDVASGLAELDVDGSGVAADAAALALLGVSDEERAKLAQLYPPGTSLWRVQVTHFTAFDCNWPRVPDFDDDADDAADPIPDPAPPPEGGDDEGPGDGPDEPKPQCGSGSIIEVQSQTLGERVDIAGTPFALNYRSSRQTLPVNDSITIPVTGPIVANRLQQVELKVEIQGQRLERTFAPSPNQSFTFSWDGRDGYGRKLTGEHVATITVTQVYPGRYAQPGESRRAFAQFSATPGVAITGERDAGPIAITSTYRRKLTARHDYRVAGIGGWLLDEHHTYDPVGQALYLGSGERRDVALEIIEQHALLVEQSRGGMAVTADGTVYVSATVNQEAIYRMVPGAAPVRVAGGARPGCTSSLPGPASSVCLSPITLDAGPDGNIYFWNDGSQLGTSILRLDLGTATVSRVAGTGPMQCSVSTSAPGDGGLAVDSPLCFPRSVAVASDGTVYIYESDTSNGSRRRIRKVTPDGIIQTVFLGPPNVSGDSEVGFDVGPDGSVYAADLLGTAAIWRLLPSGVIERFAGTSGSSGHSGDGGPALLAKLGNGPSYLLAHTDGRVFIVDDGTNRTYLRVVDQQGFIQNLIGSGTNRSNSGNNGPALKAGMHAGPIAIGPNNLLYLAQHVSPTDTFAATVRTVSAGIAGPANGDVLIPSLDGLEVYRFARNGRHLETLHSLTSSRLYGFSYDSTGRLESITDRSGNVTQFERDAEGAPTGILGPFGHHTQLTTNDDGLLASVRDPSGAEQHFGYAGGLLTSHTDVRGGEHSFEYDTSGRLIRDENAVGGGTELARATVDTTTTITRTSAEGVQRLYRSQELPEKDLLRTEVDSDGSSDLHRFDTDGTEVVTGADGTVTTLARNADPRWKMQSPLLESRAVRLPSGLTNTTTEARTVTLASASDLLSLRTYTQDYVQNGSTDRMSYSSTNRTVTLTSAAGRLRTTVLDPQGRPTRLTRASLLPTDLRYDSRGRFDRLTSGDRIVQRFFDASSNLSSSTDPLGIATTFDHDPIGRLTALHRVDGSQLLFTYDAAGHVTSATPPGRPAHLFTWTLDNLLETYTEPDAGAGVAETTYVYDLDGRLEQTIYPDGSALTAARDALNHVTQLTFPTGNVTFEYFAATACTGCSPGRLKAATADGVRVEQAFNGLLKTSTTSSGPVAGRVAWTYDNNFRPITETVTAGTSTSNATFTYDTDDLPTCVSPTNCTTPGTGSLSLGYDTAGQPTSAVIGSLSESFTYNTHGERATHTVTYAGNPLLSTTYDSAANPRDRMGRVAVRAETLQGSSHTRAYGYDTLGRLETVTQDGVLGPEYVYDPNGNRESASNGSTLSVGTYDARDRLLSYGNLTFTYGANGQLATQQNTDTGVVTTYQYDLRGSLRSVTLPGTAITYLTDAHGRRVSKRTNGVLVQRFLYKDGLRVSAELNATGGIAARFYYAGGNLTPDLMIKGTTLYRFIKDELGSPRLLIDVATGVITQQLDYDAFGVVTLDSNPGFQPFGFAGGLYDRDTKLVRFGARDYAAALGRWTTKDPLLWQGAQSNLYVYANNDPVNLRDPQGTIVPVLVAACALGGCEAVAGALATAAVWTAATLGAAYTGIELGRFLSRKFDIEQIDWIADKYGLDRDQRRRLHDEITRQDLDMDGEAGIEAIAADMAKSGRKPRPVEPERDPWDEDDGEEGGSCE